MAFDLTNQVSFQNVRHWITSIYKHIGDDSLPKILVGNKLDLIEQSGDYVSRDEARALAEEHKMNYFEVSAMEGRNISDMMNSVITQVYEAKLKPNLVENFGGQEEYGRASNNF